MRNGANHRRATLRNQRGQSLPLLAIGMLAMVGIGAGAVDIGRHAFTATELQNLADSGASAAAKAAGASYYCTTGLGGQCIPNSTSDNAAALAAAQAMAQRNVVNGEVTPFDASDVQIGSFSAGNFTAGGQPTNAVRATARKSIQNIVAGMFGFHTSTITRTATATMVALGGGIPTLPIAIGKSYWQNCIVYGCPQPQLILVPDGVDNAGWTGFFENDASQNTVRGFVPSPCGGGDTRPFVNVGDFIKLGNGQGTALDAVKCLVCSQNQNAFLVPVVNNIGQFNQTAEVVGFATIVVESFNYSSNPKTRFCGQSGGGSFKSINVRSVFNANAPGPPGPGFYGSGWAQMVG